MLEKNSI